MRKVAPTHRHFKDCSFDFSRQRSFWRGTRVRSCGACGGSWLLPKIGMMFAVDCFCRTVACMQGGLQLCAAVDIGRILDSQVLLMISFQLTPASLVRSLWRA